MDSGTDKAHKIAHASVAFFIFNSLFNLSEILYSDTPYDSADLLMYIVTALLLSLFFALPLFFKKKAPLVMILCLILAGILKFFLSHSGDVSGWSVVVTAVNYFILTYSLRPWFITVIAGTIIVCSIYYFAKNKFGFNSTGNMILYFVYVFYIRYLIYEIPLFPNYKITDIQKAILKELANGKIGKEIYPKLRISLSTYNKEKDKIRVISGMSTDAGIISWAIKNKII